MASKAIHPKVKSAGIAGAVAVLVTFLLAQVGVTVPSDIEAAVVTLITFAAGYAKG